MTNKLNEDPLVSLPQNKVKVDNLLRQDWELFHDCLLANGRFRIITESDRSYTTVLLPEEY